MDGGSRKRRTAERASAPAPRAGTEAVSSSSKRCAGATCAAHTQCQKGRELQPSLPFRSTQLILCQRGNRDTSPKPEKSPDDVFLLDEYDSGEDVVGTAPRESDLLSAGTQALLDKLGGSKARPEHEQPTDETKIIFCSRTHSQLTQFVNELRRVKPPLSMDSDESIRGDGGADEAVKHLSLGSRKNLCINAKVSRLKTATAVNERCLELQKPGISHDLKCSFLPSKDDHARVETFHDKALAKIRDIEDLARLGQKTGICPYYASRTAINHSEILTLPYPLLLQKSARQALGLSVKGHIVIIDEAHNLMDAIASTSAIALTLGQLDTAISQVTLYAQKFRNRLKGKNRVYLTQMIRLMAAVVSSAREKSRLLRENETVVSPGELMTGKGVDQITPQKMLRYLQESKLAYKVESYIDLHNGEAASGSQGLLINFQTFLAALMNPAEEGRFFISRHDKDISIRYTLLDPREHFRDIVEDARAVILAGGTMSPMADYTSNLFSYLPLERLKTYSFGHVIPAQNLLAQVVAMGPSGQGFNFNFENRRSESMIIELGKFVARTCKIVPDGVVMFFPSYEYLTQVVNIWKFPKCGDSILASIEASKNVFEESKGGNTSTEELLRDYAQAIDSGKGALILSVVGGKLSEGINFSDKLGRAVIAVGMPFPNSQGAEWKAKIEYVQKASLLKLSANKDMSAQECRSGSLAAGRDFYENACMRAVNQCIGRAIRHRNDYAAILLVDQRYSSPRIHNKLPAWIRDTMETSSEPKVIQQIERSLISFFASKH